MFQSTPRDVSYPTSLGTVLDKGLQQQAMSQYVIKMKGLC